MSGSFTRLRAAIRRHRVLRALLLIGVWLVFCCGLAAIVFAYGQADHAESADVIIVLGSGLNPDLTPGRALTRRSERAAALWKAGYAPVIICSGGYTTNDFLSEAFGCGEVLLANGVPAEAIILESRSRSTEENAIFSREIMRERGWKNALIVSDGYHLLRATWIFSLEGIDFTTSHAASPPVFDLLRALAREVAALHWQAFKTLFNLPITYVP